MSLEALIISKDKTAITAFRRVLQANSIRVNVSASSEAAHKDLTDKAYDAVIIDCDDLDGGVNILHEIRQIENNRKAVVFALLHGNTTSKDAYDLGSNFVLKKPLSANMVSRTVQAGRGLIMSDRRRHFRCPVGAVAKLKFGRKPAIEGTLLNVSDSGMAVLIDAKETPSGKIKVNFHLPETNTAIEGTCLIQWASAGKLGLRFVEMAPEARLELNRWLTRKIQSAPHMGMMPSA
jgi:ActR/RegA family two-component response regulator